jgi:heme-degrading monooxygenase HmoA
MVVARRQAIPGQGAALATAIARLVGSPAIWPAGLETVQVFRNESDPDLFLSLSAWTSREAYAASMAEAAAAQLDGLSAAPEERQPPTGVSMDHFVGILDIDLQRADDPPAS